MMNCEDLPGLLFLQHLNVVLVGFDIAAEFSTSQRFQVLNYISLVLCNRFKLSRKSCRCMGCRCDIILYDIWKMPLYRGLLARYI